MIMIQEDMVPVPFVGPYAGNRSSICLHCIAAIVPGDRRSLTDNSSDEKQTGSWRKPPGYCGRQDTGDEGMMSSYRQVPTGRRLKVGGRLLCSSKERISM